MHAVRVLKCLSISLTRSTLWTRWTLEPETCLMHQQCPAGDGSPQLRCKTPVLQSLVKKVRTLRSIKQNMGMASIAQPSAAQWSYHMGLERLCIACAVDLVSSETDHGVVAFTVPLQFLGLVPHPQDKPLEAEGCLPPAQVEQRSHPERLESPRGWSLLLSKSFLHSHPLMPHARIAPAWPTVGHRLMLGCLWQRAQCLLCGIGSRKPAIDF